MNSIIDLGVLQLGSAYAFVVVVIAMMRRRKLGRERELLTSTLRMTAQLILVGYLLDYLFGHRNPWLTLLALAVMEVFALRNIRDRLKVKMSAAFQRVLAISLLSGTVATMVFFFYVVLGLRPWYEPRYAITLAGMLIGNSMTGISLGADRLLDGIRGNRHLIEGALMLGARPERAVRDIVNRAFYAAVLPTINSMVGMGIVFLPGMMTGQILSGTSPLIAIEYQIAIMLGILGSVSLTVFLMVTQGSRTFFNRRAQLVLPEDA
jgi:putative ABC transport system permease protein